MPRIDPLQLLNCLNVLLTNTGGIRSEQEVARISSLMEKFSKKLVSKCVYLLILRSSDKSLLSKFMGHGGWNLIYTWLVHAIEAKNYPFLIELLEVILMCPVDIERLKSNPMPKQIKALSRDVTVDPKVKDTASEIVKYWLAIVKSTPVAVPVPIITTTVTLVTSTTTEIPVTCNNQRLQEIGENTSTYPSQDESYSKSTSPSTTTSEQSDDGDMFVPYKKIPGRPRKKPLPIKEAKFHVREEKRKLKSKLITTTNFKEAKRGSVKLKIAKKFNDDREFKLKPYEEKTTEEKIKEKRRLKEEKEREKFARFKQERDKKDKVKDKFDTDRKIKEKALDEKLKGDLSKLIPKPLNKLGRIPKINKDKGKENSTEEKLKDDKKLLKIDEEKPGKKEEKIQFGGAKESEKEKEKDFKKEKPSLPTPTKKPVSMSVEKRFPPGEAKPKTVKAYNSKFRLTGLEQEVTSRPQTRKGSSSSQSTNNYALHDKNAVKRSPSRDIDEPVEKKLKSPDVSFTEERSPASKCKKPYLLESDSFMNAMDVALLEQKVQCRKRKKPKSDSEQKVEDSPVRKNSDIVTPTVKHETKEPSAPAFKFYKDTLENSVDETADTVESVETSETQPVNVGKIITDLTKPISFEGLKSSLAIFRVKKHPKKSVTWKCEPDLEAVQYFEVDATERTNVVRNFWEMQMMERTKERDMMMVRKIGDNDKMTVQTLWKPLIKIDVPAPTIARGYNSQEKNIQYARERSVPPSLYYNKNMIPDTPADPDPESYPVTNIPIIPLDDISGSSDSVNDFSSLKWPEPKTLGDVGNMTTIPGFIPSAAPPMFTPFTDGTFPPPFGQPFFAGGPMPPLPVPPTNWAPGSTEQNQSTSIPWGGPNVPPPGIMGPPPFGMMGAFPPIPGVGFPPNMFPPPNMSPSMNNNEGSGSSTTDNQRQYSNNNYPSTRNNSEGGKRWNSDERYLSKKDNWRNNQNDRSGREKRGGSGSWRGSGVSGSSTRLCRNFQKKGFCPVSGCRFYHPENWNS